MTGISTRHKAFEDKYAHDKELFFKIVSRRNYVLGLQVAEQLGLKDEAAKTYAKSVIESDFQEPGDNDVFAKVKKDLQEKGIPVDDKELRYQMDQLLEQVEKEVSH